MTSETFLRWLFAEEHAPAIDDWSELERWLELLGLAPLAYATLRRRGELQATPADVVARLHKRYQHQAALALELQSATAGITRAFTAAGIAFRLLKGGALFAAGVYDDPAVRYTQDIDLLIHPRDAKRANAALESLGYVTSGIGGAPKHLPPYARGRISVELHEWAYWDARGKKVDLARLEGESLLGPTVVHLVHHLFFTSPFEPWLLVRTLQDLRELEAKGVLTVSSLDHVLRDCGLTASFAELAALLECVQTGAPFSARAETALQRAGHLATSGRYETTLGHLVEIVRRSPGWYVRDTLKAALLPNRKTLAHIYDLDAESPFTVFYYGLRPLHLGLRVVQAVVRRARRRVPAR